MQHQRAARSITATAAAITTVTTSSCTAGHCSKTDAAITLVRNFTTLMFDSGNGILKTKFRAVGYEFGAQAVVHRPKGISVFRVGLGAASQLCAGMAPGQQPAREIQRLFFVRQGTRWLV